jgi:putative ABC transport system permease protein
VSRGLGTGRLGRRALRAFAPVATMLAVVTLGMAVLATTIPRSVDGFLTEGVQYDAQQATAIVRDLRADDFVIFDYGPGTSVDGMDEGSAKVWGNVDDGLAGLRATIPNPLRDATDPAGYNVVTEPSRSKPYAKPAAGLRIGYDPRFLSRVTLVEGAAPLTVPDEIPFDAPVDVITTQAIADRLWWKVGETRTLELPDRLEQVITLSGIFEPNDAGDPYWEHTSYGLIASVPEEAEYTEALLFANAAGAPAADASVLNPRSSLWYSVRPDAITASTTAEIARQAREFATVAQDIGDQTRMPFRTKLPELLDDVEVRNASSQAILATILAGPLGLAVAIEILIARLAVSRLRQSLDLLAARGGSAAQLRLLLALPTLVIGVVATAAGVATGLLLPGGRLGVGGIAAVASVAVAPALIVTLLGTAHRRSGPSRLPGGRLRIAVEALVALATIAALVTITQRGVGSGEPAGGVDLLAAATPLLLSLLGCIVALRLYPLALGRALAATGRSRAIAPLLGIARALRAGSAGLVPILAVLIGVSVAVFSGVLTTTLSSGLETASRIEVGADIGVADVRLDVATVDEIRGVPGVDSAASISTEIFHYLYPADQSRLTVTLALVDSADLAEVQRDRPYAIPLTDELLRTDGGAVPLLVSTTVAEATRGKSSAMLDKYDVRLVSPGVYAPIIREAPSWVLADRVHAEALHYASPTVATQVLVRLEPGASVASVRADIQRIAGDEARLTTPDDVAETITANPAVGGIRAAALLAIVGSVVLSLTALVLTTVIDGRQRRRSLGLLAPLGLSRRQGRSAVAWELAPLSLVGLVVGLVLGAVLSLVLLTAVDLRPFTGNAVQPGVVVEPLWLLVIVGGFALTLAAVGLLAAWHAVPRTRSTSPTDEGWTS